MKTTTLILALAATAAFAQGPLTPPGAPAPTGKSLTEIYDKAVAAEPRILISNTSAPSGDVSGVTYRHIISQPGSYYLGSDVLASGMCGIHVGVSGVTIDLNGFRVAQIGPPETTKGVVFTQKGGALRNGFITGFETGCDFGISGGVQNEGVTAQNCGNGFIVGAGSIVRGCMVVGATRQYGFFATGSVLEGCSVSSANSTVSFSAFYLQQGAVARNCFAKDIQGVVATGFNLGYSSAESCDVERIESTGSTAFGFRGEYSRFSRCTSTYVQTGASGLTSASGFFLISSRADDCISTFNGASGTEVYGFLADFSTLTNCNAGSHYHHAFSIGSRCQVRNCIGTGATSVAGKSAFVVTQNESRIEHCEALGGGYGFNVFGSHNLLRGNTAHQATIARFSITSFNAYGPIVDATSATAAPVNGNSAPGNLGTTDPHANFSK